MNNRYYIRMKTWQRTRFSHVGDDVQTSVDKLAPGHDQEENLAVFAAGIACVAQPPEYGPYPHPNRS
jgi:hypothetical protein